MALQVNFYTFNKNPNSTKKPVTIGASVDCFLIEPTSVINPTIAVVDLSEPYRYNYAYIPEFSRYYFVNDWDYSSGRWFASLNVDVLASFKYYIGNSIQYILRSSAEFNGNIIDNLYPAESAPVIVSVTSSDEANPFLSTLSNGIFVIGIINSDQDSVGAVSYYKFTNSQFRTFCSALMNNAEWAFSGIKEISTELFKSLFNPFQYVVSCVWFPFDSGFSGNAVEKIPYGWWNIPTPATRIETFTKHVRCTFTIPKHPFSNVRGDYLNGAPYSRYKIVWPAFGTFPLDANVVATCESIYVDCWIDAVSGKGCIKIFSSAENGAVFITTQTVVGVPIQLAQVSADYLGAAYNAIGGVADFITGNIGGGISAIGNALNTVMPQVSTSGSNGMTTSYKFPPILECEFYKPVDDSNEKRGRPLCKEKLISDIPGFVLTSSAELEAPCTASELNSIKNYMDGGFFYE